MAEEEIEKKAEKSAFNLVCKNCGSCGEPNPLCGDVSRYVQAFKDGYDQGKADCLIEGKNADDCMRCAKDLIKVHEENEALKARIKTLEVYEREHKALEARIKKANWCEVCINDDNGYCKVNHKHDCKWATGNIHDDDFWELKE